jgi:hypothetical protein
MIQSYAKWFVIAAIVALLAYEAYALFDRKPGDTISAVIWDFASRSKAIPFMWGVLTAHFFVQGDSAGPLLLGMGAGTLWFHKKYGPHL